MHIMCALVVTIYFIVEVLRSSSSTSGIGFIFVPVVAVFGVFIGDTLKYSIDIFRGRRTHSIGKTAFIVLVIALISLRYYSKQMPYREVLNVSELSYENRDILIRERLYDLSFMNQIVRESSLNPEQIELIVSPEKSDFAGQAEYELYQTNVWTHLARRNDIPRAAIQSIAAKSELNHFLILALIESPHITCEEVKLFMPQSNEVLRGAIERSMGKLRCQ